MLKRVSIVIILIVLGFTLASCGEESSSSSNSVLSTSQTSQESTASSIKSSSEESSESSSEESSEPSSEESSESSSEESSESSVEEQVVYDKSVKEVNLLSNDVVEDPEFGYGNSDMLVSIEIKVLTSFNVIRNGENYDGNFILLAGDTTGTIYLRIPYSISFNKLNYMGNTYTITGHPSSYYGQNQLLITDYERTSTDINVSLESEITDITTLADVHEAFKNLELNVKGCNGGEIVKVKGTVIDDPDKNLLYIYDGTTSIKLHKNSDLNFGAFVGKTYTFYAHLNMDKYSPSLQFIRLGEALEETFTIDNSSNEELTAVKLYNTSREANSADLGYSELFSKVYTFTGYINYFQRGQNYFMVLTDASREDSYPTYTSARDAKALFIRNESERSINSEKDLEYSTLFQFIDEKVSVSIMLHEYNSHGYWTVELDLSTLVVVEA